MLCQQCTGKPPPGNLEDEILVHGSQRTEKRLVLLGGQVVQFLPLVVPQPFGRVAGVRVSQQGENAGRPLFGKFHHPHHPVHMRRRKAGLDMVRHDGLDRNLPLQGQPRGGVQRGVFRRRAVHLHHPHAGGVEDACRGVNEVHARIVQAAQGGHLAAVEVQPLPLPRFGNRARQHGEFPQGQHPKPLPFGRAQPEPQVFELPVFQFDAVIHNGYHGSPRLLS